MSLLKTSLSIPKDAHEKMGLFFSSHILLSTDFMTEVYVTIHHLNYIATCTPLADPVASVSFPQGYLKTALYRLQTVD